MRGKKQLFKKHKNMQITNQIKQIIDKEIKPMLFQDGGNIEFVEYNDGILKVRLRGACSDCEFSKFTIEGIEKMMKEKLPEIKEVKAI